MFSKLVTRRAPFSSVAPNMKFPEGTVAGLYKKAMVNNAETDVVRFDG
jgi:hypothetical protein